MEYYSIIERNGVLIHAMTWMHLENIMLSKISRHKEQILYDSSYIKYLESANS